MVFNTVIVIGAGKIARWCLSALLQDSRRKMLDKLIYIENGNIIASSMKEYCEKSDVLYFQPQSRKDIVTFLLHKQENTLIISAANYFIFPEEIVSKINFYIINYHDALLPSYPGRNAVTWAIYNNEEETGITWHKVSAEIDAGDIIKQEKITITEDIKAYELLQKSFNSAFQCFDSFVDRLLIANIDTQKQTIPDNRKIYLSTEIPNGGLIDTHMSGFDAYKLLRSMDYAGLAIMPPLKIIHDGRENIVFKYSKTPVNKNNHGSVIEKSARDEKTVMFKYNQEFDLLLRIKRQGVSNNNLLEQS